MDRLDSRWNDHYYYGIVHWIVNNLGRVVLEPKKEKQGEHMWVHHENENANDSSNLSKMKSVSGRGGCLCDESLDDSYPFRNGEN